METLDMQRQKEEDAIRQRDLRRKKEKEEWALKQAEAEQEEKRRKQEEELRKVEEESRKKKKEEEWKRLGSDVIQDMAPVPPPIKSDSDTHALKAWYLDDAGSQETLTVNSLKPGKRQGAPAVTLKDLRELGIVLFYVNLNDFSVVKQIIKERNYKHTDEVKVSQTAKDENFLERWFIEHYNDDEQIRLITDGSCYFDVRSKQDKWIRFHMQTGHLVVFPAGMYHRGTLDEDDFVSMYRCFNDAPRFVPVYRSSEKADSKKVRLNYLMKLKKGDVATENNFL
uniref:Iron(II)-requiring acireductone dioxygenase n=1 Tax=Strigomonas oncopelti TaxID=5657 RepID=U5KLR4_STROO|nr:iron(II)-requiring acireductone dioxygenase [Strigomonas oncopelti]